MIEKSPAFSLYSQPRTKQQQTIAIIIIMGWFPNHPIFFTVIFLPNLSKGWLVSELNSLLQLVSWYKK